jgi:hypothetical protein
MGSLGDIIDKMGQLQEGKTKQELLEDQSKRLTGRAFLGT